MCVVVHRMDLTRHSWEFHDVADARQMQERPLAGFSFVEVLAAMMVFTLVFLTGFAGIGRLMLIQDQSYARTIASSAALLVADWHHRRQQEGGRFAISLTQVSLGVVGNPGTNDCLLTKVPNSHVADIVWKGSDFSWNSSNKPEASDEFYVFNRTPSIMPVGTEQIDLAHPRSSVCEYDALLLCVSPPSARESDSKLTFRQITFWHGPPSIVQGLRSGHEMNTLVLVGRYVIADTFAP